MPRVIEKIWNIGHIMQRTAQQFRSAPHGDVVDVFANAELADQLIVRFEAGRDSLGNLGGQVRFLRLWFHKYIKIKPISRTTLAVDAIHKVEVARFCAEDGRGIIIFEAAAADHIPGRRHAPLFVKIGRERREFFRRRRSAHDRPNFNRMARLALVIDPAARRKHGIIEVRRKIDPAHGGIFTTKQ